MATMPGVLPWVWSLIRPQILAGTVDAAASRVIAASELPSIGAFTLQELRSVGLDDTSRESAMRVIAAYNRGNSLNIVNLKAVRLALDIGTLPVRDQPPSPAPDPVLGIPPIRTPDELDPDTASRLAEIARLHSVDGALSGLSLHLANWPGFLAAACDRILPFLQDGTVRRSSDEVRRHADGEAHTLVTQFATNIPTPTEYIPALRDVLDGFVQHLMPEMILVGFALSHAMPRMSKKAA
jgi:hypothetical protein